MTEFVRDVVGHVQDTSGLSGEDQEESRQQLSTDRQDTTKSRIVETADNSQADLQENLLFAKSNNDTKCKHYTIYGGSLPDKHNYAYQCWPPMTKSKSMVVIITKKETYIQLAKQGANK